MPLGQARRLRTPREVLESEVDVSEHAGDGHVTDRHGGCGERRRFLLELRERCASSSARTRRAAAAAAFLSRARCARGSGCRAARRQTHASAAPATCAAPSRGNSGPPARSFRYSQMTIESNSAVPSSSTSVGILDSGLSRMSRGSASASRRPSARAPAAGRGRARARRSSPCARRATWETSEASSSTPRSRRPCASARFSRRRSPARARPRPCAGRAAAARASRRVRARRSASAC